MVPDRTLEAAGVCVQVCVPLWFRAVWFPPSATETEPSGPTASHWAHPEPVGPGCLVSHPASVPEHTTHISDQGNPVETVLKF